MNRCGATTARTRRSANSEEYRWTRSCAVCGAGSASRFVSYRSSPTRATIRGLTDTTRRAHEVMGFIVGANVTGISVLSADVSDT